MAYLGRTASKGFFSSLLDAKAAGFDIEATLCHNILLTEGQRYPGIFTVPWPHPVKKESIPCQARRASPRAAPKPGK